jgi:hypothetical protein
MYINYVLICTHCVHGLATGLASSQSSHSARRSSCKVLVLSDLNKN